MSGFYKINMNAAQVERILVISLSNLGDVILTTPVMAALREHFPAASICVVAGPRGEAILQNSSTINEVLVYDKTKPLIERAKFVWGLRKKKFDLAVDLRNTAIPILAGTRRFNSIFFNNREKEMRKRHLSRLRFLGIGEPRARFQFFNSNEEKSALAKLEGMGVSAGKNWIALAPGAANHLKRWPLERYSETAVYFSRKGYRVLVVGSRDERAMGDQILKANPGENIVNLCGLLELRELASVLSRAKVMICNDSGLMHLSNELDIPVAAIFGTASYLQYAKVSTKNRVIHGDGSCFSINQIKPYEVIHACEELLNAA